MKNMTRRLVAMIPALGLLVGCTAGPHGTAADSTSEPTAAATAEEQTYLKYAGAPIDSFTYIGRYNGFKVLGPASLAIWTQYDTAYLLTVRDPCPQLSLVDGLELTTATARRVQRSFDYVVLEHDRCQIDTIRKLDFAAMKAAHVAGP